MGRLAHIRVTAIGRLGPAGAGERFQYGINLRKQASAFDPNNAAWQDLADDVSAFHGRPTSFINVGAVLEEVKIASIAPDELGRDRYTDDPIIFQYQTPGGAGTADQRLLPQSALAVSLMTERRGRTGRGRFFLPLPNVLVDSNDGWRIPAATATSIGASAVQLLDDMANQPGFDLVGLFPVVASTKGYHSDVTQVRVGRIVDTIRSRRRSLDESYVESALTNPGTS
jgi:hypothetical protein